MKYEYHSEGGKIVIEVIRGFRPKNKGRRLMKNCNFEDVKHGTVVKSLLVIEILDI